MLKLQWLTKPVADLEYPKSKVPTFLYENVLTSFSRPTQKELKRGFMPENSKKSQQKQIPN